MRNRYSGRVSADGGLQLTLVERFGRYLRAMTLLDRITTDPEICHGQPTVGGLRYPVQMLLELLSAGMTIDEVLADYPDLERVDFLAALEYGALLAGGHRARLGVG